MEKLNEQAREEFVELIAESLHQERIETFRELFLDLHPADQAEVFLELDEERSVVYEFLSPEEFAEVFDSFEPEVQKEVALQLNDQYAAEVYNNMYADDVADFLGELEPRQMTHILQAMDQEDANDVRELLAYEEKTAGAIMTKEFVSIKAADTIDAVIEQLRREGPDAEMIYYLYVVDERDKLAGVASIRDLIVADSDRTVAEVMSSRVVSVHVEDDQEEVAQLIQKYDFLATPVIDSEGRLVGIVTVDDALDVLAEEASEDIGEISGSRGSTDVSVNAFKAARLRAPWIILLMFLGLFTAQVIGWFESTLESVVLLAAFIPMIMGSAGNTGTQSLAVSVRALATGNIERKGLWRTISREFSTGIMIGVASGIVITILLYLFYGEPLIGIIVGFSIMVSLGVASVIGTLVPLVINKLKLDPAIASGPFITTLTDIISLLIYFTVASSLIQSI